MKRKHVTFYVAVLSTIAKIWKQPKCVAGDEWTKKSCGTFTQWNSTWKLKKEKKKKSYLLWQHRWTWRVLC